MEKRTVFQSATLLENGILEVKLRKEAVDAGVVVSAEPHRKVIGPDEDIATELAAVSANLADMGFGEVPASVVNTITALKATLLKDSGIKAKHDAEAGRRRAEKEAREAAAREAAEADAKRAEIEAAARQKLVDEITAQVVAGMAEAKG